MKFSLQQGFTITGLAAAVLLSGCSTLGIGGGGQKSVMERGDRIPAAEGQVVAKEGDNGNTRLDLHVKHLAKPEQVSNDARTYVVWAQDPNGGDVHNLGALQVNDSLEGKLSAITPLKNFDVFVTTEPSATERYPTGYKALWSHVTQR